MDAVVYDKVGKEAKKIRDALYGIYPQETITDAAIASFDDGADGIPVQKLVANIEPVQDLHGYDHPWPAGGWKNKLPITISELKRINTVGAWDSNTYTVNGIAYTAVVDDFGYVSRIIARGTATNNADIVINSNIELTEGTNYYWGRAVGGSATTYYIRCSAGFSGTVYDSYVKQTYTSGTLFMFARVNSGVTVNGATFEPMICAETETDLSFTPYSNICPISGHTGANVTRAGANLFDETANPGKWIDATGAIITSTATSAVSDKIYVNSGVTTAKIACDYAYATLLIAAYDSEDTLLLRNARAEVTALTMTIPEAAAYIRFAKYSVPSACYGYLNSEDIIREEFNGLSAISVTFPASAGTVYGGTLDVTNGTLTVDRAVKNLNGSENWIVNSAAQNLYYTGSDTFIDIKIDSVIISDTFSATSASAASMVNGQMKIAGRNINFKTSFETLNDWKAELQQKNVQVVYEVITPITYQLTPQEVSTLYGTNNICADTGNIKKLTYRADLGKYIDSHITTAVANALNA